MKSYILRERTLETSRRRNPYRPKGQVTYGAWRTVGTFETLEEALRALRARTGLYDRAIFFEGRRIPT